MPSASMPSGHQTGKQAQPPLAVQHRGPSAPTVSSFLSRMDAVIMIDQETKTGLPTLIRRLAVALFSTLLLSNASASWVTQTSYVTLDSFSASPAAIASGDSSAWTLGMTLNVANLGEQFSSANLIFSSGDGQTSVFNGTLSGSSTSIGESFTYASGGTYFGSVFGTVVGSWTTQTPIYASGWIQVWGDYACTDTWGRNAICTGLHSEWRTYATGTFTATAHEEIFTIDGSVAEQLSTTGLQPSLFYRYETHCSTGWYNQTCWTDKIPYWLDVPVTQTLSIGGLTVADAQATSVPEPGTLALFGAAFGGLALIRRRKNL